MLLLLRDSGLSVAEIACPIMAPSFVGCGRAWVAGDVRDGVVLPGRVVEVILRRNL